MQLGFVGLGKMGLNMVTRLDARRPPDRRLRPCRRRGRARRSRRRRRRRLARGARRGAVSRRARSGSWCRPARRPSRRSPRSATCSPPATSIIDGGNTNFHDDVRRADDAEGATGSHYVDAGTSGGIWGLQEGYCLMVGGDADVCQRLEPIFLTLAPPDGYLRVGETRRRALREDDPQRHRVRPDAGLRRRLRADARQRLSRSTSPRSPRSGCTAASCDRGCSS